MDVQIGRECILEDLQVYIDKTNVDIHTYLPYECINFTTNMSYNTLLNEDDLP
jgi:hypothetical protein